MTVHTPDFQDGNYDFGLPVQAPARDTGALPSDLEPAADSGFARFLERARGKAATNTDLAVLVWLIIIVGVASGLFLPH